MKQCFVCYDTTPPLYSLCECRDRYLHIECQRQMIEHVPCHHSGNCIVCNTKFKNLAVSERKQRVINKAAFMSVSISLFFTGIEMFVSLLNIMTYSSTKEETSLVTGLVGFGIATLVLSSALFFIKKNPLWITTRHFLIEYTALNEVD